MEAGQLIEMADTLLAVYKDALLIDPFIKISIDISDGNFVSECTKDSAALSWRIKFNPTRHSDIADVQYSIVESILIIMFDDFSLIESNSGIIGEYRKRLISRLTTSICQMMNFSDNDQEESAHEE